MTTARVFAQGPYGAFELKRCYRKNMITGTLISGALPLLLLAILTISGYTYVSEVPREPAIPDGGYVGPVPPPIPLTPEAPSATIKVKTDIPSFGADLRPVEDNHAPESAVLMTGLQKVEIITSGQNQEVVEGFVTGVYAAGEMEKEMVPPVDTFISFTKFPVAIYAPQPAYPEMARKARMEGEVWVKIYIDKNGNVLAAQISKSTNKVAGFEESALAAAWKCKYTPALQNDQPVGVWISYKVSFRLRE